MQVYGIDLSMEKFDVNYIDINGIERKKEVKNRLDDISKFLSTVSTDAVRCAEVTGTYSDMLVFQSNQAGINIALVPGYTIKHSLGMVKGKSDTMDAMRIREYGERFYDKCRFNSILISRSFSLIKTAVVQSPFTMFNFEFQRAGSTFKCEGNWAFWPSSINLIITLISPFMST